MKALDPSPEEGIVAIPFTPKEVSSSPLGEKRAMNG
jgi:hypothetical protein